MGVQGYNNTMVRDLRPPCVRHKIPKQVRSFFERHRVSYSTFETSGRATVPGRETSSGTDHCEMMVFNVHTVRCVCSQCNKVVLFVAVATTGIQPNQRAAVLDALNDRNNTIVWGRWSVTAGGDVRFQLTTRKERGGPSEDTIVQCLAVIHQEVMTVTADLLLLVNNNS